MTTRDGAAAPQPVARTAGRHDAMARRRAQRRGRERGCWVFVPAEELLAAGIDPMGDPPFYRTWGRARGSVMVRLYKEA